MAKTKNEKLAELLEKEAQIKAQIQAIKQRDTDAERKKDARRKILIGGDFDQIAEDIARFNKFNPRT